MRKSYAFEFLITSVLAYNDAPCHYPKPEKLKSVQKLTKSGNPPYQGGAVYYFPNTITENNFPSTLESITYKGLLYREFWNNNDGGGLVKIDTHVFDITTTDDTSFEFILNANDFTDAGENSDGYAQVVKHATAICRLPWYVREKLDYVGLSGPGDSPFGATASTGKMNLNTHRTKDLFSDGGYWRGTIEELLLHEGSHVCVDSLYKNDLGWQAAQDADNRFISTYARDNPTREDIAETLTPWMLARQYVDLLQEPISSDCLTPDVKTIVNAIPNRLRFLELNLSPIFFGPEGETTSTSEISTTQGTTTKETSTSQTNEILCFENYQHYDDSVGECVNNVCICENGRRIHFSKCFVNGGNNCRSCNEGYKRVEVSDGVFNCEQITSTTTITTNPTTTTP